MTIVKALVVSTTRNELALLPRKASLLEVMRSALDEICCVYHDNTCSSPGLPARPILLRHNRLRFSLVPEAQEDDAGKHQQAADDLDAGQLFTEQEVGPNGGEGRLQGAD